MAHEAQSRLRTAVLRRDVDGARRALDDGADVRQVDEYGFTPLGRAVFRGDVGVARLLLDRGANLNERDNWVMTPGRSLLHAAVVAQRDRVAVTRLLVDRGLNVSQTDDRGDAPLHMVAERGDADVASFLLDRGADIDQPGRFGYTPLIRAVIRGNVDVMRLLLRRGADIDRGPGGGALTRARQMHARMGGPFEAPADSAAAHVLHFEAARAEVTRKLHADIWLRVMPFTM